MTNISPLLTIAIPTYNRKAFLKANLEKLLQQVNDEVEVVVSNNASTDGTDEMLKSFSAVSVNTHSSNVGAERNILSCFKAGTGKYVWTLCDDDLPYSNSVELILDAIKKNEYPAMLFVKSDWQDFNLSSYSSQPLVTDWKTYNRDEFLNEIGQYYSVTSSNIIKRELIDIDEANEFVGTNLSPVMVTLSVAGRCNTVVIPDKALVACRGGNSGGYDGLTTFTRNIKLLFSHVAKYGYKKGTLRNNYKKSLEGVVLFVIKTFPITTKGIFNLFVHSYSYKIFYTRVIPALLKKLSGKSN